jgi:hypothetical protein
VLAKLRSYRPSHTTVVAYLALFVALGGSSYAAITITGKNVKNSSLTGKDIKNSSLSGVDVKNGGLTGSDVRDDKLTGRDVLESSLGTVPSAAHAGAADNSGRLAGQPASAFQGRAMWALVDATGTIIRQSGGISLALKEPDGAYTLQFPSRVTGKAIMTSVAYKFSGNGETVSGKPCGPPSGDSDTCSTNPSDDQRQVFVFTTNAAGTQTDGGFYIAVLP